MPEFGYGCAVFMQSDIVDFQRQGWAPDEIMAGLAACCRRTSGSTSRRSRTWPSSARTSCCRAARSTTSRRSRRRSISSSRASAAAASTPDVIVHKLCGEPGAIGCARRSAPPATPSTAAAPRSSASTACGRSQFRTTRDERHALLLLQEQVPAHLHRREDRQPAQRQLPRSGRPWPHRPSARTPPARRAQVARCRWPSRRAAARSSPPARRAPSKTSTTCARSRSGLDAVKAANPNLVEIAAHEAFKPRRRGQRRRSAARALGRGTSSGAGRRRHARRAHASAAPRSRIGMPARAEHVQRTRRSSSAYFQALGLRRAEPRLQRLHQRGALQGGRQARRDRPVLPQQDRHPARARPARTTSTRRRSRSTTSSSR